MADPTQALEAELQRAVAARWGSARVEALRPGLNALARNLALVAAQPLDLLDEIPDTFGAEVRDGATP
jgi:hypothetical protein